MADRIAVTKLHGLGNDFLVIFTDDVVGAAEHAADLARRLCDRHRGIGADGLLLATPSASASTDEWTMVLHNADGSRAEMSGNGIRCFAQAVIRRTNAMLPTTLRIATDGGERVVEVVADPTGDPDVVVASVSMGIPSHGPMIPEARPDTRPIGRLATWDLGNPHLVLEVDDPHSVDLASEGPAWEALFPAGMNVHFVALDGADQVTQVTWERGAGITEACGTGATAVALTMHAWGETGDNVQVTMPGGAVRVGLGDEPVLHGPSAWIADAEVRR